MSLFTVYGLRFIIELAIFRYPDISLSRYFVIPIFRYPDIS